MLAKGKAPKVLIAVERQELAVNNPEGRPLRGAIPARWRHKGP
jgi:hypothetical protein